MLDTLGKVEARTQDFSEEQIFRAKREKNKSPPPPRFFLLYLLNVKLISRKMQKIFSLP